MTTQRLLASALPGLLLGRALLCAGVALAGPSLCAQAIDLAAPSPPAAPASPGPLNRMTIVLDPAHGGLDAGSRIGESGANATFEKDVTLALAFRLRSLLVARGFTVVLTRDSDAAVRPNNTSIPLTLDDRAGIANHARASACLLLHATGSGDGVHLYTSELDPVSLEANHLPWLTAQAAWAGASRPLEQLVASAFTHARIPLVASRASVRPVDSLTCPALVVEIAPEADDPASINGTAYQQRIAEALANALVFWPRQFTPPALQPRPVRIAPAATSPSAPETTP